MSYTLGEELSRLRLSNELTKKELATSFGVSINTLYRWEYNISNPSVKYLEAYERKFNLQSGYFKEEMWKDPEQSNQKNQNYICESYYDLSVNKPLPAERLYNLNVNLNPQKEYYAVRHTDELSTYPFIIQNDLVIVEATSAVFPNALAIIQHGKEVIIRKIEYIDNNKFQLVPLLSTYPTITIETSQRESNALNDYEVLGIVTALIREFDYND